MKSWYWAPKKHGTGNQNGYIHIKNMLGVCKGTENTVRYNVHTFAELTTSGA